MSAERSVELTSSGFFFNPERLFWIAGQINKQRPAEDQIAVELYPVHYFMGWPLGPGRIDSARIHNWQKEHGSTPIERIHLPFHWNLSTAFKNFFWNSLVPVAKPYEPGAAKNRVIAMGVSLMTTTIQNRFATNLAREFEAGINAHVYIIEEAAKRNQLGWIRDNARYTWIENDLDYPRLKRDQLLAERDPQRAIGAVEQHGLEGVILGADHDFLYGLNPIETLEQNQEGLKRHLRCVHLAGSGGYRGLPDESDVAFWQVVDYVRNHSFDHNVRFCLDLSPFDMRRLKADQQLDYIKDLVKKLEAA